MLTVCKDGTQDSGGLLFDHIHKAFFFLRTRVDDSHSINKSGEISEFLTSSKFFFFTC